MGEMTPVNRVTVLDRAEAATLYAALPPWISAFLPPPESSQLIAPIKTLTPAQLKKIVLALSTPGKLSDLPTKTVNLLIFNNATVA